MNKDERLHEHLEFCEEHCQRLKAEGRWPWAESPTMRLDDNIEQQSRPSREITDETIVAIEKLVTVLRKLNRRLASEGYEIIDGEYRLVDPTKHAKTKGSRHPDAKGHQAW